MCVYVCVCEKVNKTRHRQRSNEQAKTPPRGLAIGRLNFPL